MYTMISRWCQISSGDLYLYLSGKFLENVGETDSWKDGANMEGRGGMN
jgi:hypothetical protein